MKRLAFILLLSLTAAGQPPKDKTHIHISCTCEDQVGELFATALRDAIANSPRFTDMCANVGFWLRGSNASKC